MALGPRSVLGHHPPRGPSTTPAPTPQRERQAVQSMNRALLNRVLKGDAEAIEQFGESDHCAVVDWKDDLEAIVVAVSEFVPTGCLRIESPGSDGQRLVHADGKVIESPSATHCSGQSRARAAVRTPQVSPGRWGRIRFVRRASRAMVRTGT